MEIKIRYLTPIVIKQIDQLAKSKGQNRQEFLKEHLESVASVGIRSSEVERLEKQIEANNLFMKKTSDTLDELVLVLKELLVNE
ncbi:MAG: hypothetical protein ACI35O_16455 [Bacillaceae bacterium]